ncbi:MAG: M23 family metallopeptidase [Bdellovibrionales bacterium]|nr:M23 family metallopeptidase [Bdellovibrionales bacterium]
MSAQNHAAGGASKGLLLIVIGVAALIPVALVGWRDLYASFIETSAPEIVIRELPRGIGLTPISLEIEVSDELSGLDEVVVRSVQNNQSKELLRQKLSGNKSAKLTVHFPGKESDLEEGMAQIEIRAFDKSLWSNRGEKLLNLPVDYRRPKLEIVSTQHNAREGGSQLIFFKAFDEDLAVVGVKVGGSTFLGYPAHLFDETLTEKHLYATLYAVPLEAEQRSKTPEVRAFAEDRVGNAVSSPFYNKIAPRRLKQSKKSVPDVFLRTKVAALAESIFPELRAIAAEIGEKLEYRSPNGTPERLVEEFKLVNEQGRALDETKLLKSLSNTRLDRLWDGFFERQSGVVRSGFGENVTYFFQDQPIGTELQQGYILTPHAGKNEVLAANSGVVALVDRFSVLGRVVVIDHGLGLSSLYGSLGTSHVQRGDQIEAGQVIGTMGESGLADSDQLVFQMRVSGTPVDPTEWLSRTWYRQHITSKTDEVKRALGIPVYQPFS